MSVQLSGLLLFVNLYSHFKVLDVLFATSSMSAVLIHHYPLHREARSALSLSLLALLVSPVSNAPTDPFAIVLAIGLGAILFVVFWVRFWINIRLAKGCPSSKSRTRYFEIAGMETARNFSINIDDDNSQREEVISDHSSQGSRDHQQFISPLNESVSDKHFCNVEMSDTCSYIKSPLWSKVVLTLVGIFMVVIAFSCYIFQNRETYWIVHSTWHLLAMGSTYLFIRNKNSLVNLLSTYIVNSAATSQHEQVY